MEMADMWEVISELCEGSDCADLMSMEELEELMATF
jgi:hypothetical protein